MKLSVHRRLAADILGVGIDRVWIDPSRMVEVSAAITRDDIRRLIRQGAIKAKRKRAISRGRFRERAAKRRRGLRRGAGSRKGAAEARHPKKERWIRTVRPLRARLRELRRKGEINAREYRMLYRMVKGGSFKSKAHLETYLKERASEVT